MVESLVAAGADINVKFSFKHRLPQHPALHELCRVLNGEYGAARPCDAGFCYLYDHKYPEERIELLRYLVSFGAGPHIRADGTTAWNSNMCAEGRRPFQMNKTACVQQLIA